MIIDKEKLKILIINLLYNYKFSYKFDCNVLLTGKRKGLRNKKSIFIAYKRMTKWNTIKNWFKN